MLRDAVPGRRRRGPRTCPRRGQRRGPRACAGSRRRHRVLVPDVRVHAADPAEGEAPTTPTTTSARWAGPRRSTGCPTPARGRRAHRAARVRLRGVLRDDGFFSGDPPVERIDLAEGISDTGEYLARMLADGRLATDFGRIDLRVAYFPPCHTRRQQIGRPYVELLRLIPGLTVEVVGEGSCCGMGGNSASRHGPRAHRSPSASHCSTPWARPRLTPSSPSA